MSTRRTPLCLVALFLALLVPRASAAQGTDDVTRARTHHEAGVSYFDQGRYEEAAEQFREAYALSGRAHLLLNVSRAHELAGQPAAAADALEEYLAREPNVASRVTLERRLAELRARGGASGGGSDAGGGPDYLGPFLLMGGTGLTLVAAIITGVAALDLHASVSESCGDDLRCPATVQSDIDTGTALALSSDILFGVTGALAIGTTIWFLVAMSEGGGDDDAQVSASCGSHGCAAGVRGRF